MGEHSPYQELNEAYDAAGMKDRATRIVAQNCEHSAIQNLTGSVDRQTQRAVFDAAYLELSAAELARINTAISKVASQAEIAPAMIQYEIISSKEGHLMQPLNAGILQAARACKTKTASTAR